QLNRQSISQQVNKSSILLGGPMSHHRNHELTLLGGVGLGAGLMFLLDPDRGKRRRAWMRDKCVTLAAESQRGLHKTARDFRHRLSGLVANLKSIGRKDEVPDEVVAGRVRSKLGRLVSHPGSIDVGVFQGCVTLRGLVLASDLEDLLSGVSAVKG